MTTVHLFSVEGMKRLLRAENKRRQRAARRAKRKRTRADWRSK
jgi:hypothetical protein